MRRWIHFQVLILLSLTVFSQDRYTFERFDASRGLSEDHVIAMLQDREGFLWFGTMGGLNRYDGDGFKTFTSNPDSPVRLSHQRVHALSEDVHQNIWITPFGNVFQKINRERNMVTSYPQSLGYEHRGDANQIYYHPDGYTVMAFQDIGVFIEKETAEGATVQSYLFEQNLPGNNTGIDDIYVYDENNIFLATFSGPVHLRIAETGKGTFEHFAGRSGISCHTTNVQGVDSLIYFTSRDNGIIIYNTEFHGIKST